MSPASAAFGIRPDAPVFSPWILLAELLEERYGILTRCGLHCAPSAHKTLGTFPGGTVRFSLGFASTEDDVLAAAAAIRELSQR